MNDQHRLHFFRPSTWAFIREARRTPGFSLFDWLHGYVYMRWPYLYIGLGTGEHPLTRWLALLAYGLLRLAHLRPTASADADRVTFADTYHGKVVTLPAARRLVTINREINLTNLEQVIPYRRARDLVLSHPRQIVVLECPCRANRANPCLPLDVCLIIGDPFAGFVAEHHPGRARRITAEEAVAILEAEHRRGHIHHAFFKDAMLGRFYAICNCCACCCGAMQAQRNGIPMLATSGYVSQVDEAACLGCGLCTESCQFGAISLAADLAVIDPARCMGCGVCVSRCPQEALSLQRESNQSSPLDLNELLYGQKRATALCSGEFAGRPAGGGPGPGR